jgi:hypothetical protein
MMEVASSECNDSQQNTRKNMKSKFIQLTTIAAIGVAILSQATQAIAGIPTGLFKFTDTTTNKTHIYLMGQASGAESILTYAGVEATKNLTASACGLASWKPTTTSPIPDSFTVNGVTVTTASLPVQLKPGCTNGTLEEARTAHFKTSTGEIVLVGTASQAMTATYSTTKQRKAKANLCGIVKWSSTTSYPNDGTQQVALGSTAPANISSLATPGGQPVCRTGTLYIPASWAN